MEFSEPQYAMPEQMGEILFNAHADVHEREWADSWLGFFRRIQRGKAVRREILLLSLFVIDQTVIDATGGKTIGRRILSGFWAAQKRAVDRDPAFAELCRGLEQRMARYGSAVARDGDALINLATAFAEVAGLRPRDVRDWMPVAVRIRAVRGSAQAIVEALTKGSSEDV